MTLLADVTLLDGTKGRLRYVNVLTRDLWTKMDKNWAMKSSAELHSEASVDTRLRAVLWSGCACSLTAFDCWSAVTEDR